MLGLEGLVLQDHDATASDRADLEGATRPFPSPYYQLLREMPAGSPEHAADLRLLSWERR